MPAVIEVSGNDIVRIDQRLAEPSDGQFLNFQEGFLIPGLIDLQINGAFGFDFSTCSQAEAKKVLGGIAMSGTTSVCPTVITSRIEQITKQIEVLSSLESDLGQARNLGVHLEGPAISAEKKGAHDAQYLTTPRQFITSSLPLQKLRILTLAPELPDAGELIQKADAAGVIVSIGHTNATSAETREGKKFGARMVTHLFNGMRSIHQREPGPIVTTLLDEDLHFGLIVDGEHVDYDLVRMAQKLGQDRMIIVSDASAALNSKPGTEFDLGGSTVIVDNAGNARRNDGTLASSGSSQLNAIENAVKHGFDRALLLKSATVIPADFLGEKKLGRIAEGAYADLVHYTVEEKPIVDFALVGGELCRF